MIKVRQFAPGATGARVCEFDRDGLKVQVSHWDSDENDRVKEAAEWLVRLIKFIDTFDEGIAADLRRPEKDTDGVTDNTPPPEFMPGSAQAKARAFEARMRGKKKS